MSKKICPKCESSDKFYPGGACDLCFKCQMAWGPFGGVPLSTYTYEREDRLVKIHVVLLLAGIVASCVYPPGVVYFMAGAFVLILASRLVL